MQNILEEHRDAIIDEKNVEYQKLRDAQEAWNEEIEAIKRKNDFDSPILTLDLRG